MNVQDRIRILLFSDKIEKNKEYAEKIGVSVVIKTNDKKVNRQCNNNN